VNSVTSYITFKKIFIFWLPLAATWLMMAVEGPFLAAIIARLAQPKYNLAAYGVAFSFGLIIEAPIIMIMSAATALVENKDSFVKLRNFTYALNTAISILMLIFLIPPVFYFTTIDLIGLPQEVAKLTHLATLLLLPWPGMIGYRRFYQGVLIRSNLTRRVAYGTLVRLTTMSLTALILYKYFTFPGAVVGAVALSLAVTLEAFATRLMAYKTVKYLQQEIKEFQPLTYSYITKFYYPLALTSILALGVHPLVTFFVGRSPLPLESLAVLPVINALVFIFRSMGLSFQEVGISLVGKSFENYYRIRNFALLLAVIVVCCLAVIAFTPLARIWFHDVSGLSVELTNFALLPLQIMCLMPGLAVVLSLQRAILVSARRTTSVTWATIIEVSSIVVVLFVAIFYFELNGAVSACLAFIFGRLSANLYLIYPYSASVKRKGASG